MAVRRCAVLCGKLLWSALQFAPLTLNCLACFISATCVCVCVCDVPLGPSGPASSSTLFPTTRTWKAWLRCELSLSSSSSSSRAQQRAAAESSRKQ